MPKYSLSDIMNLFSEGFKECFGWFNFRFEAEINRIKKIKKNIYLELIESDLNWHIKAKTNWIIFDESLQNNLKILTQISNREEIVWQTLLLYWRWNFHKDYWFSIIINSISPEYIKWKFQSNKEKIKEELLKEKIFENNLSKNLWYPPFNIALISWIESEWKNDFIKILSESKFKFKITNYASSVHWNNAKEEILKNIKKINSNKKEIFDLIAIIRWWWESFWMWRGNDINIAKEICYSNIPIMVAVWHTKDTTILDEISKYPTKTPSDAAHLLIEINEKYNQEIKNLYQEILYKIQNIKTSLNENSKNIYNEVKKNIQYHKKTLFQNIENLKGKIDNFSPEKAIKKGYWILMDSKEKYISQKNLKNLKQEEIMYLKIYNKKIKIQIKKVENIE